MKNEYCNTTIYDETHVHYGGKIFFSDFDYRTSLSDLATRILYDLAFDRECERNGENRNRRREAERRMA
ncbi:MAG: hypothetical protein HFI82_02850 [Eubacterium sp.]|jgi:hypothetical protein|nr:hypothetical protein [Eubacterium sp.]